VGWLPKRNRKNIVNLAAQGTAQGPGCLRRGNCSQSRARHRAFAERHTGQTPIVFGVAVFAAVAMPAQCGECGSVGGVIGAGEAAFGGEIAELGIGQPGAGHGLHAPGLGVVPRFGLELADANEIIQRWLGQSLFQSGAEWVG